MPKQIRPVPTTLYDHQARKMVARQLNLSRSVTKAGRSWYSYTNSQVPLKPLAPAHTQAQAEHKLDGTSKATSVAHTDTGCLTEVAMDIDVDHMANPGANVDEDADQPPQPVEVMPGIQPTTKPKGPRANYENSVSLSVFI
jgi:hypothetical protein